MLALAEHSLVAMSSTWLLIDIFQNFVFQIDKNAHLVLYTSESRLFSSSAKTKPRVTQEWWIGVITGAEIIEQDVLIAALALVSTPWTHLDQLLYPETA